MRSDSDFYIRNKHLDSIIDSVYTQEQILYLMVERGSKCQPSSKIKPKFDI